MSCESYYGDINVRPLEGDSIVDANRGLALDRAVRFIEVLGYATVESAGTELVGTRAGTLPFETLRRQASALA